MSDSVPGHVYSIDTSSLMDWQARNYPTDIFVSLIRRFDELIAARRLLAPELVAEEAGVVGTAELVQWCADRPALIVPTGDILAKAVSIQQRFPGLLDPNAQYEEADAYVIALASIQDNGIVVTQETTAAEKKNPKRSHFIPDVCRELGITCINILGLMRREKWTF